MPAHGETADRLTRDFEAADAALKERIASLLRPLARDGVNLHLTAQIVGPTISVKLEPPPHRWVVEGKVMRKRS